MCKKHSESRSNFWEEIEFSVENLFFWRKSLFRLHEFRSSKMKFFHTILFFSQKCFLNKSQYFRERIDFLFRFLFSYTFLFKNWVFDRKTICKYVFCGEINLLLEDQFFADKKKDGSLGFFFYYTFCLIFLLYLQIFQKSLLYLFWLYLIILNVLVIPFLLYLAFYKIVCYTLVYYSFCDRYK